MGSSPGGQEVFRTKDGYEIIHQVSRYMCRSVRKTNAPARSISSPMFSSPSHSFPLLRKQKSHELSALPPASIIQANSISPISTPRRPIPAETACNTIRTTSYGTRHGSLSSSTGFYFCLNTSISLSMVYTLATLTAVSGT